MPQDSSISVVIPTHDDGELLERCLASVFGQTLPADEVIVVDDGSTSPRALAAIDRALERFPAVLLLRQPALGPSAARNRGAAAAAGTFLAFVDADDELLPESLARKRALFGRSDRTVAAFAGIKLIEPDGTTRHSDYPRYDGPLDADLVGKPDGVPGFLWAYLIRAEAFREIGGLDEGLRIMEDFDLLVRLGRGGGWFAGCNDPAYIQHRRPGSLARGSALRQFRGALRFLNKAAANRYFSRRELMRRYLLAPYAALKIVVRYGWRP